jgi:outer membrane protein assembly factor BamE (lipoprotein component of BamABCDE complex)
MVRNIRAANASFTLQTQTPESKPLLMESIMSLLKHVDRIAILSLLSVTLGLPVAALACSAATANSSRVAARVALPGGGESRFYTTGPAGVETCRVDVSAAGDVLAAVQVLTDGNFRSINVGMSASDVMARIGPPSDKSRFEGTKTTSWDYHFADLWNYDSNFSVVFNDNGIVVSKFVARNGN